MRLKKRTLLSLLSFFILFASCEQSQKEIKNIDLSIDESYIEIADTIINDVVIKNSDNDEWTEYCLRNLDKKTLVNEIFNLIYSEELIPYDFFQNTQLSIDDIKALEKDPEFSRDKISKVQFEEAWYFDTENQKMLKKVHSIMLAYEIYDFNGEVKGYKPAFKVYFK